ncbi:hypothetical protein EJ06DRAFT_478378 [Trichodelitschia bisporula]|uniref:Zn(2)-C6 fungal-type domain-containing protein n=1 Tax=Trichodelitschia bisporula TaxID=703511 RepID=A0A6G1HTW2_9PEZI|nr:hypothetical protein EJ06DRAFT_478378 [Trichodelitschia bisporula]
MENSTPRPRASKACVICHKKKIKCDLDTVDGIQCTACIKDNYECRPRERKRKRTYTLDSVSPPPRNRRGTLLSPNSAGSQQVVVPPGLASEPVLEQPVYPAAVQLDGLQFPTPSRSLEAKCEETPAPVSRPASVPALVTQKSTEYAPNNSYLGRSEYISNEVPIDDEADAAQHLARTLSEKDMEILQHQRVFELPERAIRESLIDAFWSRCWPWTPMVERSWIEGKPLSEVSTLLLQGMLLAGSRVSSTPMESRSPGDFYSRGKTLFWMGAEKDPLIMAVSACLLNWWNPEGPEHFSIDTSGFWIRICVGLAYQLGLHRDPAGKKDGGLRRRVWWSLLQTRDCLINAGHGRPRSINLQLTDVSWPTLHDFDGHVAAANLFSAYVGISVILGDLTQCFLEDGKLGSKQQALADRTFRWSRTLSEDLQICFERPGRQLRPYCFEARQLHAQYFTVLTIMNRTNTVGSAPSTASLLASSYVAGIFEDFLARDELRYLGPIFTFYLLSAGLCLLSCYRYPGLWHLAEQDLRIIFRSQEELGKRWPSAIGSLNKLTIVRDKVTKTQRSTYFPENNLTPEQIQFFDNFGTDLCRSWSVLYDTSSTQPSAARDLMTAGILQDLRTPGGLYSEPIAGSAVEGTMPLEEHMLHPQLSMDQYSGIGNWLFNDVDSGALW